MKKKIGILAGLGAALFASAALAAGIVTAYFPQVTAANIVGTFRLPVDTAYAGGVAPQTAYITTADLKTYTSGGAIVTGTASSGAVTTNGERTIVTSEALTTAAAAIYTLTETNSAIAATSLVTCSVGNGTNTQGVPVVSTVVPAAGSVVVKVQNNHASQALNGTITIACRASS
jgi:hypothetical protein